MPDDNGEIFPCHLAEIYNEEKNLDLGLAGMILKINSTKILD